jgi:hypothetical protein
MTRNRPGLMSHGTRCVLRRFVFAEMYRTLPVREEVLRAVLGADLIGFHTYDYARHFISSCTRILGLEVSCWGLYLRVIAHAGNAVATAAIGDLLGAGGELLGAGGELLGALSALQRTLLKQQQLLSVQRPEKVLDGGKGV